jgi:hypothetical protein
MTRLIRRRRNHRLLGISTLSSTAITATATSTTNNQTEIVISPFNGHYSGRRLTVS